MHDNLSSDEPVDQLNKLEICFADIVKERVKADPEEMLKINKDSEFTENPMERENIEESVKAESVKSLDEVYNGLKQNGINNIEMIRVPVVEESAPKEVCFDILVNSLKQEPAGTQCVFSCQAGRGRTTLGKGEIIDKETGKCPFQG